MFLSRVLTSSFKTRHSIHSIRHLIQRDTITTHLMRQLLISCSWQETDQCGIVGRAVHANFWPGASLQESQIQNRAWFRSSLMLKDEWSNRCTQILKFELHPNSIFQILLCSSQHSLKRWKWNFSHMIRFVVCAPNHALILSFWADLRLAAHDGRCSAYHAASEWRGYDARSRLNDPTEDITNICQRPIESLLLALSFHRDQSHPDICLQHIY